jgi:hypothetical protein
MGELQLVLLAAYSKQHWLCKQYSTQLHTQGSCRAVGLLQAVLGCAVLCAAGWVEYCAQSVVVCRCVCMRRALLCMESCTWCRFCACVHESVNRDV